MISSILNVKEIGKTIKKAVYIQPTQVEAIFEGEATSPTGEMIIKPCNAIDELKKQLHREQRKWSPSSSDVSSNDEEDTIYGQRSRTPPNESFSYDEECLHRRKRRRPSRKEVGTDVMKKALS